MCQGLTYEEFVQKLRKWIIKAAHLPEDYVFFKKKEKTGITANGDRLFVVCAETDSGKDICGIYCTGGFVKRDGTSAGFLWKNFTRIM